MVIKLRRLFTLTWHISSFLLSSPGVLWWPCGSCLSAAVGQAVSSLFTALSLDPKRINRALIVIQLANPPLTMDSNDAHVSIRSRDQPSCRPGPSARLQAGTQVPAGLSVTQLLCASWWEVLVHVCRAHQLPSYYLKEKIIKASLWQADSIYLAGAT